MKLKSRVGFLAGGSLLLVSIAAAAQASANASGTTGCGVNQIGHTMSYSSGTTRVRPPQPAAYNYSKTYSNGSTMTIRHTYATKTRGGFWIASTNGSISDATYANCVNSGTP